MEADLMSKRPKIGEIYKEYVERTFRAGVMDFDDLLLKTNELLNKFPDVLAKYQERFKYILVDEYQTLIILNILLLRLYQIDIKTFVLLGMILKAFILLEVQILIIY